MIPKVIHWCWLSGDPLPSFLASCIESWKKHLPDYEIKLWNMQNFDVNSVPYVAEAVKRRKWAFACDYIRAYALYTEGGIYMDSDVFVRKNFDFVLQNRAFSAMETYPSEFPKAKEMGWIDDEGNKSPDVRFVHATSIQAAILGAEKGHPFFKDCLDYYHTHSFILEDGSIDTEMISPYIFAELAVKYGFKYQLEGQLLAEGFRLYDSNIFAPESIAASRDTYAIHCCAGSWRNDDTILKKIVFETKELVKKVLKLLHLYYEDREKKVRNL